MVSLDLISCRWLYLVGLPAALAAGDQRSCSVVRVALDFGSSSDRVADSSSSLLYVSSSVLVVGGASQVAALQ